MAEVHHIAPFAPVTTSALWARFPRLQQVGDGVYHAQCPVDREHGTFEVREAEDGWRIGLCVDGCVPREIWNAVPAPPDTSDVPRFKLESLAALLAEDIPPTRWLLTPYVPAASFGELVGPPGKGKTTFMGWMIMQMAKAGFRVAIIEEEGSRRGLQRLLGRALAAAGDDAKERVSFMHAQHVSLLDAGHVRELAELLKGFDFVLFDSFSLVTPGLDEDKSKEMGPVIRDLRWLRDQLGIAVWLNHHSGKSIWKSDEVPRLGDGRGSSALPGALDAELSMKPLSEPEDGFIQFDLYVTKMREADDQVRPQRVSIARNGPAAIVEMSDLDTKDPGDAAYGKRKGAGRPAKLTLDQRAKAITEAVREGGPIAGWKIKAVVGGNSQLNGNLIKELCTNGVLRQDNGLLVLNSASRIKNTSEQRPLEPLVPNRTAKAVAITEQAEGSGNSEQANSEQAAEPAAGQPHKEVF
jgi:hypothetical protein